MPATPTPEVIRTNTQNEQRLDAAGSARTHGQRRTKHTALYAVLAVLIVASAVAAYFLFKPAQLGHPDFDPAAVSGEPAVDERYGYSTLQVDEEYRVMLCGVPANDGQTLELYLTNPADNGVWFRAELLDQAGEVLYATGVLRQGQHLPTIALPPPLSDRETPITVRIVAYEPDTWQSRGNVNLNLTIYKDFR